jgi:hypothetical protein
MVFPFSINKRRIKQEIIKVLILFLASHPMSTTFTGSNIGDIRDATFTAIGCNIGNASGCDISASGCNFRNAVDCRINGDGNNINGSGNHIHGNGNNISGTRNTSYGYMNVFSKVVTLDEDAVGRNSIVVNGIDYSNLIRYGSAPSSPSPTKSCSPPSPPRPSPPPRAKEIIEDIPASKLVVPSGSLAMQPDEGESKRLCVICDDNVKQYACSPCGHYCLCAACPSDLKKTAEKGGDKPVSCPICKKNVTGFNRVFDV